MTGFVLAAAALVAVVLLLLLPPLLGRRHSHAEASRAAINAAIYRDQFAELERDLASGSLSQADFDEGKRELQRRLLEDAGAAGPAAAPKHRAKRSAVLIGIALPLAAALLYFALGNLAALSPENARPKITAREIDEMVAKLAARMEQNPDDPKGWVMLARSYKALGRYEEAVTAFGKAAQLVEQDPQLLSDYAEALAIATGGSLKGKPTELIERALKLDPNHPQALVLAGTAAYEREDFAVAADHWEKLLKQLPADSEDAKSLAASIKKARAAARSGGGNPPTAAKSPTAKPAASVPLGQPVVSGRVELDPALRSKVADGDTVFVFARAAEGPRMPLAALRKQVRDLPLAFAFDDAASLSPDRKLSSVPRLVIVARISKTGDAAPAPDDIEALSPTLAPGATDVRLRLGRP